MGELVMDGWGVVIGCVGVATILVGVSCGSEPQAERNTCPSTKTASSNRDIKACTFEEIISFAVSAKLRISVPLW